MRICCSLAVALSLAETLTMPFASMSKVTSICGMPRGAAGMPTRSNWPRSLLSDAISRSPWKTRMVTAVCPSSAVEKTWLFLVGIVVLRSIRRVNTPPSVSMPSESGVTSSSRTSVTSPCSTPAWMAAPTATTSSGFYALVRLAAEEILHHLDNLGHAGHAADEDDLVDLGGGQPCILERRPAGLDGAGHQVLDQGFELGPRHLHGEVLGPARIGRDEGQVDLGLHRARELDLGLLRRLLESLERELVLAQVDAVLLLELVGEVAEEAHVEVLAAEEGIAVGGLDLEDAVADLQDRNVEGAAAEIVDGDGAAALLVEAVGERGRGGLVDDAQHLEARNLARVLGRLALGIVEVGRHRDDRLGHGLAEEGLGGLLHLLQGEG